jgi:hypothetical protein
MRILVILLIVLIFFMGCISNESHKGTIQTTTGNNTPFQTTTISTTKVAQDPITIQTTIPTSRPTTKSISIKKLSKVEIWNKYNKPIGITLMSSSSNSPVDALLVNPDQKIYTLDNIQDGRYYAVISQGINWDQDKMKFLKEDRHTELPPIDMKSYSRQENNQMCDHYTILRISMNESEMINSAAFDSTWCSTI